MQYANDEYWLAPSLNIVSALFKIVKVLKRKFAGFNFRETKFNWSAFACNTELKSNLEAKQTVAL